MPLLSSSSLSHLPFSVNETDLQNRVSNEGKLRKMPGGCSFNIYCSRKVGDIRTLKFVALTKIMEHI